MNNYNLDYSTNLSNSEVDSNSDSEEETYSEDNENNMFLEDKVNQNNLKYITRTFHILLSSINRNWKHPTSSTFFFQTKFNASYSSIEEETTYTGEYQSHATINKIQYTGSQSLSIPIDIKNIESIHIEKLIIPNRKNYLGNGVFNDSVNLNTILLHIEEFSFTNYGSNDGLNDCFCSLASTTIDSNLKFIEYDNLNDSGKIFRPVPLNSIHSLTFKLTDSMGNKLQYLNEYLQIKNLEIDNSHNKFIKITTQKYFSRNNYQEGDIFIFNSCQSDNINHNSLMNYLNSEKGHAIFFKNNDKVENGLEDLYNNFYISKKGDFNLTNGNYELDTTLNYDNFNTSSITGDIINRNLQLFIKFKIESKEKDYNLFNPVII